MLFKKESWPEGTIIKENKVKGIREVILPEATDMGKFNKESRPKKNAKTWKKSELSEKDLSGQSSVEGEPVNVNDAWDNGRPSQKKINTRQERIIEGRRRERRLKDLGHQDPPSLEL